LQSFCGGAAAVSGQSLSAALGRVPAKLFIGLDVALLYVVKATFRVVQQHASAIAEQPCNSEAVSKATS
jgi:uncharacterized membrane protein